MQPDNAFCRGCLSVCLSAWSESVQATAGIHQFHIFLKMTQGSLPRRKNVRLLGWYLAPFWAVQTIFENSDIYSILGPQIQIQIQILIQIY